MMAHGYSIASRENRPLTLLAVCGRAKSQDSGGKEVTHMVHQGRQYEHKIIRIYHGAWGESPRDALKRFLEDEAGDKAGADRKMVNEFAAPLIKSGWRANLIKQLLGK